MIIYLAFLIMTITSHLSEKPKLIYIGDPMCSWCYGIAPELDKVKEHFGDKLDYELVLGGLRPYNTQVMTELKDFLTDHWKHVNEASGQEFDYNILNSNEITYDTEPPCRAVTVVKDMAPDKTFEFFALTQKAFYKNNKNMHLTQSYFDALESLEINSSLFKEKFESDDYKSKVKQEFLMASQMGVNSFPTIILQVGDEYYLLARGYAKGKDMIEQIEGQF